MKTESQKHETNIILTCEHASNNIPAPYSELFADAQNQLDSHQGWDIGAPEVVNALGKHLGIAPHMGAYSRLLVDLNRSPDHFRLFSRYTKMFSREQRDEISQLYYRPYRDAVHQNVIDISKNERAVHLSIHSFTPQLDGVVRQCDIGLLYDPSRPLESEMAKRLQEDLGELMPSLRVRRNYPYNGIQDGIIPRLRKSFDADNYFGLEIEMNQALFEQPDYKQNKGIPQDWAVIFVKCLASRAKKLSRSLSE